MSDFRNSKTKDNLMRAFAGESQARNRYTMAEEKARQQKLYVLADLFKFTADQEKVHAKIFYEHLKELSGESVFVDGGYPVDISEDMCTLLGMADHNERQESEDVYPAFAEAGGLWKDSAGLYEYRQDRECSRQAFCGIWQAYERGKAFLFLPV